METKHTPGPWYATYIENVAHIQSASLNEDNYICQVVCNDDVDNENVNLIAAAPELLEVLEELLSRAREDGKYTLSYDGQMCTDIINAIRNATGE